MRVRVIVIAAVLVALGGEQAGMPVLRGQGKSGLPDPPKKDVPYIIHADLLIETDAGEATEETRKDEQLYAVRGAAAAARTPLAGPELLFHSEKFPAEKLLLYRLEPRAGRREVIIARKKKPVARPMRVSLFRIREKIVKIRVDDSLAPGEYCLSPDGSNAVFCFGVD